MNISDEACVVQQSCYLYTTSHILRMRTGSSIPVAVEITIKLMMGTAVDVP